MGLFKKLRKGLSGKGGTGRTTARSSSGSSSINPPPSGKAKTGAKETKARFSTGGDVENYNDQVKRKFGGGKL
jgi:hypothetical protein